MNEGIILVNSRNLFYRSRCLWAVVTIILCTILVAILTGLLGYLIDHRTNIYYFSTDETGRIMQAAPLDQPVMSDQEVVAWTVRAIEAAFSYDFVNYRAELQSAQPYFNDYGWRHYMDGLKKSGNLVALTERKYVVMASVAMEPKWQKGMLNNGTLAWQIQMPVLVKYYVSPYHLDEQPAFWNPLQVNVLVARRPMLESDQGLGIIQIIATLQT